MQLEDLIKGLWNLVSSEAQRGEPHVEGEAKAIEILDALLASGDLALMELIPIFLGLSGQRGFSMDLTPLFEKYGPKSQLSETLEKFLLITLDLLQGEGLPVPASARKKATPLKKKWGDLISSDVLELGSGVSLKMSRLREVFKRYAHRLSEFQPIQGDEAQKLHQYLRLLFSPKQEELIMKKLEGEAFTKTEREYYSRVVKKKLKVLADKPIHDLASKLISS